jgi:FkbM family methyltransferase
VNGISHLASSLNRSSLARSWVSVWGNVILSPSFDRTLYLWLHRLGWMGAAERRELSEGIRAGMHVVDVGANIGLYTGLFSRLVGCDGSVISVEPVDANWQSLRRSIERNQWTNVELHHCALAAASGHARMVCDPLNSGNNRIEPVAAAEADTSTLKTLDEIVAGRRVDLLKIDVQGWEAAVLRGGVRTLRENRPMRIFVEIWPSGLEKAGSSPREIYGILHEAGFEIDSPAGWMGENVRSSAGYYDVVAVAR